MDIVQSTWVRYHHIDLARELHKLGHLKKILTSLPWWKADKESREHNIPRDRIECNFIFQGIRNIGRRIPGYNKTIDNQIAVQETKFYSRWVARHLPPCDTYIGISGTGLHAGRAAKRQGSGYVMDRGSSHIRYADRLLQEEHARWNVPWTSNDPWLMENEEAEAAEADFITVPSDFAKSTFIAEGVPAEKMRVVPYGVPLGEFSPSGTPPDDGTFRLVFVGQFSLRKGVHYLLQAFKKFNHPKKELIVVGSVPPEMESVIQSIGSEGVKFVGIVPRREVKQYLSTSHALVLPSIEEGLALVQGQALACGCPVIATPNTGSQNLFTHNQEGLIVEIRNVEVLVDAFEKLASSPSLRQALSQAALARAQLLGGWGTYAAQMVEVAREAKAKRSGV